MCVLPLHCSSWTFWRPNRKLWWSKLRKRRSKVTKAPLISCWWNRPSWNKPHRRWAALYSSKPSSSQVPEKPHFKSWFERSRHSCECSKLGWNVQNRWGLFTFRVTAAIKVDRVQRLQRVRITLKCQSCTNIWQRSLLAVSSCNNLVSSSQHFKDLIRLRRTTEWPRSSMDSESTAAKETPEIEPLPFTLSHECCISVVQKLTLFLLSMDFTCHADLLLFVCKVRGRPWIGHVLSGTHTTLKRSANSLGSC